MISHRYLRLVSRNYNVHDQAELHYLSYATVAWVDVFTRRSLYSSARDEAGLPGMLRLETIWGEFIPEQQAVHNDHKDQ